MLGSREIQLVMTETKFAKYGGKLVVGKLSDDDIGRIQEYIKNNETIIDDWTGQVHGHKYFQKARYVTRLYEDEDENENTFSLLEAFKILKSSE